MKFSPFFAPIAVLLAIAFNQTFAQSDSTTDLTAEQQRLSEKAHIEQIADNCHQNWQQLGWKMGEAGILARENPAFSEGIMRVCQARAELFFEGYEISPFIKPDSQQQIFPIVFQSSVDEIKDQIRIHLPRLQLI